MKATVRKWGNSAAVRIPAAVMEAAQLRLDDDVEVREDKGRVIIAPARQKSYRLADLVKRITSKNLHEAVVFEPPAGNEIW